MSAANNKSESDKPQAKKTESEASPKMPEIDRNYVEHHERRWLMLIVYFVLALAVAVLVVFGARWLYHVVHRTKTTKPTTTSTTTATQPPATPGTGGQSSSQSSSSSSSSSRSSNASSASSQSPQTGQLPNNGPGDVISIFVGVALMTGSLHYLYHLRRRVN